MSIVSECQNQLEWTAFCYAAGELGPVEAEQFELRLEGDQEAREALARAVELTQVVTAAESRCGELITAGGHSSPYMRASWSARLSWMAVGGLAALALAMVWSGGLSRFATVPENAGISSENDALASAWSATRKELRDSAEIGPLHPLTGINSEVDSEPSADIESSSDELAVADAPAWMTIAIEGLASEMMDQDESGSDEPVVN